MSCDVGKATEGLENELWCRWSDGKVGEWANIIVIVIAKLILQPFRNFTYVTTHSPTLPSLYLRHSSFSNPSVASPTSHFILQHFFRFSYVTSSSLNSPGEPPMSSGTYNPNACESDSCRENHTRHWIRGSRVQTRRGSMDFFQSVKILNMTSFGREVKPLVQCRRFTARKTNSSWNYSPWAKFVGLFTLNFESDTYGLWC